jgi:hypothetical protein
LAGVRAFAALLDLEAYFFSFLGAEIEERFLASLGMTGLLHDDAQTWQRSTNSGIKPLPQKNQSSVQAVTLLVFFP